MFSILNIHHKFVIIVDWIKLFLSEYFTVNISPTYISVVIRWKNMQWLLIAEIISLKKSLTGTVAYKICVQPGPGFKKV